MAYCLTTALALLLCASYISGERYIPVVTTTDLNIALLSAFPGDRIHLLNTEPLIAQESFVALANGTAAEPITIEGQGLENAYLGSSGSWHPALQVLGNNWIIRNFTISGSYDGLELVGNNNLVEYVTFRHRDVGFGVWIRGNSSFNTITNCSFPNITYRGILIDNWSKGNNITSIEFVSVGQASEAILIFGSYENCCGYIAGNMFRTSGLGSWLYFVYQSAGHNYRFHNNYGTSIEYNGFGIYGGNNNEFRGNHCERVESTRHYCIFQGIDANGTLVYYDNTCSYCVALTNVAVIDD